MKRKLIYGKLQNQAIRKVMKAVMAFEMNIAKEVNG